MNSMPAYNLKPTSLQSTSIKPARARITQSRGSQARVTRGRLAPSHAPTQKGKAAPGKKGKVIQLAERRKNGLLNALERETMVIDYRGKARTLAHSILRKWHARLDMQEVDSVVDLSLCEAVNRFNRFKGASFMTFLFYHLRGNLIRAVSAAASTNFVPFPEIDNPENSEAANRIVNAMEIADMLCSRDLMSPDEALLKKEVSALSASACRKLDSLEQEVVQRIFVNEEQLMDVARSLGYSRCHISRVKKKALQALFKELRPAIDVDGTMVEPDFDQDFDQVPQASAYERRMIKRRRPRSGKGRATLVLASRRRVAVDGAEAWSKAAVG
jgi:RNA polymerase sigma factor (sigma-70 family)